MRILYVEDNPVDVDLTMRALERFGPGASVEVVRSLAEARAKLAHPDRYDLVLSDVGLPDGRGPELVSEIRERSLPLAVVMFTGTGDVDTVVAALKAGADDYLVKGVAPEARLAQTLEAALARFRVAARTQRLLHVLYAEPDAEAAAATRRHLDRHAPNVRLEVVATTEGLRRRLLSPAAEARPCDVLLLECRMEGEASLDVLKALLEEGRLALPVVMLGREGDEELAAHALRLGANVQYVVKHANYRYVLPATLESAHRSALLVREERALRESEARLAGLVEAAMDAIVSVDESQTIVLFNPAAEQMFRCPRAQAIGRPLEHFIPERYRAEHRTKLAQYSETGSSRRLMGALGAVYGRRGDGEEFPIEASISQVRVGGRGLLTAILRDISERLRSTERLRASEEQFRQLAENIEQVFWTWDPRTRRVLYASPAYDRIWGRPRSELEANPDSWLAVLHPEDRQMARQAVKGFTAVDFRIVRPDGLRWIHGRSFPVLDAAGQLQRIVGVAEDVTERRRAEQELHFRNAMLSTQQEASIDGLLVVDQDARIVTYNQRFVQMWGIPHDMVEAKRDAPVLDHATRQIADPAAFQERVQYLYEHREETSEDEIALLDGRVFDRYSAPMFGPDRVYYGRVWSFRDITSRKRAEAEREQLQTQLQQAQKMEAIGRLAGGVAHDFNNMLGVILGYADLALRRLSAADPLARNLAGIKAAAERSSDLTRRLLAFSRRQTIAPRVLDLNSQLQVMESLLRRIIGEDVELVFRLAHGGWLVSIDPSQLDQVLANLAVNARDAMPEGGRLVVATENVSLDEAYCRRHAEAVPGDHVCLSVSDDGCGMDAATLSRAFEPFFTTKPEGKGTGLGLATVYGIARQNGGHVSAYSEPGRGTTFRIYLPRQTGGAASLEPAEPSTRVRRGHETILLVEDEESLRVLSRELLEELGYQVLAAAGPGEALALCEKHPSAIDLLLTDVVMPVMGGRELAERVAALRPGIKVLFSSGYTADAIAHQGVLDAGVHLLEKPFVLATLARKVAEVLGADPQPPE